MPASPAPPAPFRLSAGPFFAPQLPVTVRAEQPLAGLTLLAVEDSRYASEALRLLCRRAGARLRRAETIAQAEAHLRVYRPDVVIVDLGLPDGPGEGLIRALVRSPATRPRVVLGTSGAPEGRAAALAAGANGFLEKPVESLAALCAALRRHLPDIGLEPGPSGPEPPIAADPLALQDDLAEAARRLQGSPAAEEQRFVSSFLRGLARSAHDPALETAALQANGETLEELRNMVDSRLAQGDAAFPRSGR